MTCPICKKYYARTRRDELSVYVYRKACTCRRPVTKGNDKVYDIRDCWRDEVGR